MARRERETTDTAPPARPDKKTIRACHRRIRDGKDASVLKSLSKRVAQNLLGWEVCRNSSTVALYAPLGSEVDLLGMLPALEGKKVFFPKVCGDGLRFFQVSSANDLSPGAFSIPEPPADGEREARPAGLDLIVVPGICFDRSGSRIGSGGGFYDRALSDLPPERVCAAAYSFQLVDFEVPAERHDRRAGFIATEEGVFSAPAGKKGENHV